MEEVSNVVVNCDEWIILIIELVSIRAKKKGSLHVQSQMFEWLERKFGGVTWIMYGCGEKEVILQWVVCVMLMVWPLVVSLGVCRFLDSEPRLRGLETRLSFECA